MAERLFCHARCQVADTRNSADTHSHMLCCDRFHRSRHADCICAEPAQQFHLCRCFIGRSRQLRIHALLQSDLLLCRCFFQNFLQLPVVYLRHVRKPYSQFVKILPDQRIGCKQRNVIRQQHQIPCRKRRIDPAGGICQKQKLRSHPLHQPDRQHHIRNRIALIKMDSSLHAHHRNGSDPSKNKFSCMSGHGRNRKTVDFMVIQFCLHPNFLRVVPKPRTEHQRNLRRKRNLFLNTFVTAYKLFIYVLHDVLFSGNFILLRS